MHKVLKYTLIFAAIVLLGLGIASICSISIANDRLVLGDPKEAQKIYSKVLIGLGSVLILMSLLLVSCELAKKSDFPTFNKNFKKIIKLLFS